MNQNSVHSETGTSRWVRYRAVTGVDAHSPALLFHPSWKKALRLELSSTTSKEGPGWLFGCDRENREPTAGNRCCPGCCAQGSWGRVCVQEQPPPHLSGERRSFLLTWISLYAYIHNFKVVFSRKCGIKTTPMFA